jgi:hypothetical protein
MEARVWRADGGFSRLATDDPIAAGAVIALEWGSYCAGHAGIVGTTVACGEVDLGARRRRWLAASCDRARAGRVGGTAADLRAAARAAGASALGLLAHGLGVGIEPPLVGLDGADATPFAAGTPLVLAPVVDGYRASRALLVERRSARWLEPAP